MNVYAEDSKSYVEESVESVESEASNNSVGVSSTLAIVSATNIGTSESASDDSSEKLRLVESVESTEESSEANGNLEQIVKETGAIIVTVDGQNVHNGMTLDKILESASSDEEYVWKFLTSPKDIGGADLTEAGAAAVMGCMQAESGVRPYALNYSDGGYGLLQWTDTYSCSRKSNLISWCAENGYSHETLLGQLNFASHELETVFSSSYGYPYSVYETLTSSGDIDTCLRMFFSHAEAGTNVEISSYNIYAGNEDTYTMYEYRLSYAWGFYRMFANNT